METHQKNAIKEILDLLSQEEWKKCIGFGTNTDKTLLLPISNNCAWTLHPHGIENSMPLAILCVEESDNNDLFVGADDTLPLAMCRAWLKWKCKEN